MRIKGAKLLDIEWQVDSWTVFLLLNKHAYTYCYFVGNMIFNWKSIYKRQYNYCGQNCDMDHLAGFKFAEKRRKMSSGINSKGKKAIYGSPIRGSLKLLKPVALIVHERLDKTLY